MRKTKKYRLAIGLVIGILASQTAGCGQSADISRTSAGSPASAEQITAGPGENENNGAGQVSEAIGRDEQTDANGRITVTAVLGEGGEKTISYEPEDLVSEWEEGAAVLIELTGDGIVAKNANVAVSGRTAVIKQGGIYVVSGQMEEGQLRIEAGKGEIVRLILNGVELSNGNTSPIYGAEKCKVVLTLADGTTNIIRDGSEYRFETEGEDEPDAPIFTKGDLTINGTGELQVYGNYRSGIRSKDNLKVISGRIAIEAMDDGLKGRDSVIIRNGTLKIQAVKDGIKSNQDEDPKKGFIWIDGGEISIAAKDDGIQAETALIVCGGNIQVTESQEGLAGKTVDILGGVVKAVTEDDGINAAISVDTEQEKMENQEGVYIRIAGGEIWLNAKADGIDSNGDLYLEGGGLYLSGPVSRGDGIFDYNGKASITGGTVFAAGSSGMMQSFGEDSASNYLVIHWEESQEAGSRVQLSDGSGSVLGEYAPEKEFDTMIISVPGMEEGNVYYVKAGEKEENTIEITVTGRETVYGTSAGRGMGGHGPGGRGGGFGERRQGSGAPPELPEGAERGAQREGRPELPEGAEREGRPELPEGEEPSNGRRSTPPSESTSSS